MHTWRRSTHHSHVQEQVRKVQNMIKLVKARDKENLDRADIVAQEALVLSKDRKNPRYVVLADGTGHCLP